MANLTLAQLEDALGTPIILVSFWREDTKRRVEITVEGLPVTVQQAILAFINAHLPNG